MTGAAGRFYWLWWLVMKVPGWWLRGLVIGMALLGAVSWLVFSAYVDARKERATRELRRQRARQRRLILPPRVKPNNCEHWIPEGF